MSTVGRGRGWARRRLAALGRSGRSRLRPRIWHKLAVIGLVFMLPLAVSSFFLAIENGRRIEFSENELRGVAYLRPLSALLVELGRHNTLSRQVMLGERPAGSLRALEERIDADFADLLAADRRVGRQLRTTADQLDRAITPAGLARSWRHIRSVEPDPTSSDAGHEALSANLRKLIGYVGITSNLTLDPELATYYAADALIVRAPEVTDRLRQIGDSVAKLIGEPVTLADRTRVASAVALLDLHVDALHDDLFTVFRNGAHRDHSGSFRTALDPLLLSAYTTVTGLRELTTHGFVHATATLDRTTYLREVDTATDAMAALWTGLQEQEGRLLRLRLADDARNRTFGVATVLTALATAALLTIWLSRRITQGVGTVSRVATELAGGDLTRRVPPRGRDEIGALAMAFNSMATRLQETVGRLRRSQRKLRAERDFVDAVVDVAGSLVLVLDRAGRIVRFNRTCEITTGYSFLEAAGRRYGELFAPADGACAMSASVGMPAADFPSGFEDVLITRDGARRHVAWSNAALVDEAGTVTHVIATGIDITERRAAERGMRDAQERFRLAFDNAPIGMCLVGRNGRFTQVNRALCEMLGYGEQELLARSVTDITHPDDVALTVKAISDLAAGHAATFHTEKRYLHADGHVLWALISVSVVRGGPDGPGGYAVAQIQDITQRRAAEVQLVHRATHDPLTGLPNRVLLMDRLQVALGHGRDRPETYTALLFVDLDGFKAINDSLGHDVADRVLVEVGHRLRQCVRPSDTVARLGGDEFVIMCEGAGPAEPGSMAEIGDRLVRAFARPVMVDAVEVSVTTSVGIAYAVGGHATAEDLIRDADAAMYRAKARGKNRYEVFDESLRERAADRVGMEGALRRGLREDRLRLFFQPIVDVRTAAPVAVEALVRLDDPERGLLAPESFMQAAEDSGLIVPIGAWAMTEACRQLAGWRSDGVTPEDLHVAVNLSVRQASRPDLVDTVVLALIEAALPPQALALEVTESVLIEADATTLRQLRQLRDMGVRLGLDDFGTGYSSLTYLKRLPVSFLKIDKSFVSGIVDDPSDRKIVTAVIRLAQALGLVTVAEGVETPAQLAMLQEFGCDQAQGYLFGRPRPGAPAAGSVVESVSSVAAGNASGES